MRKGEITRVFNIRVYILHANRLLSFSNRFENTKYDDNKHTHTSGADIQTNNKAMRYDI